LIGDGFFEKPKTISEVKSELGNRGHHMSMSAIAVPLMRLCRAKVLRRQKSSEKNTYEYSAW
jgi:predicted transcriptional regulator